MAQRRIPNSVQSDPAVVGELSFYDTDLSRARWAANLQPVGGTARGVWYGTGEDDQIPKFNSVYSSTTQFITSAPVDVSATASVSGTGLLYARGKLNAYSISGATTLTLVGKQSGMADVPTTWLSEQLTFAYPGATASGSGLAFTGQDGYYLSGYSFLGGTTFDFVYGPYYNAQQVTASLYVQTPGGSAPTATASFGSQNLYLRMKTIDTANMKPDDR